MAKYLLLKHYRGAPPAVNNVRSSGAELLLPLTRWGDGAAR